VSSFEGVTAPDFSLNAEEKGKLLIRFPQIREADFGKECGND
jgi:hypothetical protein